MCWLHTRRRCFGRRRWRRRFGRRRWRRRFGRRRGRCRVSQRRHVLPLRSVRRQPAHPGSPGGVRAQRVLMAHNNQAPARPRDGDVQAALVRQEAHPALRVAASQRWGRARGAEGRARVGRNGCAAQHHGRPILSWAMPWKPAAPHCSPAHCGEDDAVGLPPLIAIHRADRHGAAPLGQLRARQQRRQQAHLAAASGRAGVEQAGWTGLSCLQYGQPATRRHPECHPPPHTQSAPHL